MPKTYVPKKLKRFTQNDVQDALADIATSRRSIRAAANHYGMSEAMLRKRIKNIEAGKQLTGSGRKPVLDQDAEKKLAICIAKLCQLGFSPTRGIIQDLVRDYVTANNVTNCFNNNRPGKDWLRLFMSRNRLSLKRANMISLARKSATSNPFIVYDFYDVLEKIVSEKNLSEEQIWNCDESGFPSDPQKCKVVGPTGEICYKVTPGAGRENTTTLAVCSAAGRVLDPLIIFQGKNLQSTWKGDRALKNTFYSCSDKGWMTTEIFSEWFTKFLDTIKERPLLLIFDGHLTHISIPVLERAINEDVIIIKLPPHVTDKLQPLDKTCFGPLKRMWEKTLNDHVSTFGANVPMRKPTFVNLISDIWHKGITAKTAIAGFRSTGIFPVDRSKFPTSILDQRKVRRYKLWVESGKPEEDLELLNRAINTPMKYRKPLPAESATNGSSATAMEHQAASNPDHSNTLSVDDAASSSTSHEQQSADFNVGARTTPLANSTPNVSLSCACDNCTKLGPKPPEITGKEWFPAWTLRQIDTSFEAMVLNKMKGPLDRNKDQPEKKRKKVHMKTKVITEQEYLTQLQEMEEKDLEKERKKEERERKKAEAEKEKKSGQQKKKTERRRKLDFSNNSDESSADDDDYLMSEECDNDGDLSGVESEDENVDSSALTPEEKLLNLWKSWMPPTPEEQIVNHWFAAIWPMKNKFEMYIGKAIQRFLMDENGPVEGIELDCLKLPVTRKVKSDGSIVLEEQSAHNHDIDVFPIYDVVAGPLKVTFERGNLWRVDNYSKIEEFFEKVKNIKRKDLAEEQYLYSDD